MGKSELTTQSFDYSVCTTDEKGKLIWAAAEVGRLKGKGAELVIEMGKVLATAQEQLAKHGTGTFCAWVENECGLSKRNAYRSIEAFAVFGGVCANVAQFEVSAIYELASRDTPKEAVKESLKLASAGLKITTDLAKKIVKKHAEKKAAPVVVESSAPVVHHEPESNGQPHEEAAPQPVEVESIEVDEAEPEAETADDSDSLEAVQADLREYERRLRDLARYGRKILGAEGSEITRPWCGCYSVLSLIHPLQHVARTVLNDLPVGGEPSNPRLAREEIAEAAK